MALPPPSPRRVPVLTEVIDVPPVEGAGPTASPAAMAPVPGPPEPASTPMPPAALDPFAERVLADLQRQIDLMLEQRLREQLAPALSRLTDALVREVRQELGATLRDLVHRAIANELSRLPRG